jgi:large subunit ribosomal protein L7Ae
MTAKADERVVYEKLENAAERYPIARGVLETVRLLEKGKAKLVLIALNVEPKERLDVVRSLCDQKGVPVIAVSDKLRLGEAAGLEVATSCVALPVLLRI